MARPTLQQVLEFEAEVYGPGHRTPEQQRLRTLFYDNDILSVHYCADCDSIELRCGACGNISCNGSGCDVCREMFSAYIRQPRAPQGKISLFTQAMYEEQKARPDTRVR